MPTCLSKSFRIRTRLTPCRQMAGVGHVRVQPGFCPEACLLTRLWALMAPSHLQASAAAPPSSFPCQDLWGGTPWTPCQSQHSLGTTLGQRSHAPSWPINYVSAWGFLPSPAPLVNSPQGSQSQFPSPLYRPCPGTPLPSVSRLGFPTVPLAPQWNLSFWNPLNSITEAHGASHGKSTPLHMLFPASQVPTPSPHPQV